jgi:hypothetical protein
MLFFLPQNFWGDFRWKFINKPIRGFYRLHNAGEISLYSIILHGLSSPRSLLLRVHKKRQNILFNQYI